jgi:hypothetical protein
VFSPLRNGVSCSRWISWCKGLMPSFRGALVCEDASKGEETPTNGKQRHIQTTMMLKTIHRLNESHAPGNEVSHHSLGCQLQSSRSSTAGPAGEADAMVSSASNGKQSDCSHQPRVLPPPTHTFTASQPARTPISVSSAVLTPIATLQQCTFRIPIITRTKEIEVKGAGRDGLC